MTTASAWDCAEARPSLGVYVLGAIDPGEHDLVDTHLAICLPCQDQIAELADLPGFLARLSPGQAVLAGADDIAQAAASGLDPGDLPGAALHLLRARRRRNRRRCLAAAAAAAAIAAGLLAGLRSAGSARVMVVPFSAGGGSWQTAHAANQVTGASATVAYARQMWGTAVEVLTDRVPVGTTCQLWVVHPDGTRTLTVAWTNARDEGHVWYAGSMPSTAGAVAKFQITAGGRILLTVPPA